MNCSSIWRALAVAVFGLGIVAGRVDAQTCRGTEAIDRDHPAEVGVLLGFGENTSSLGGAAAFGNKREYVAGSVERATVGGQLFGAGSNAALRLTLAGGAQWANRRKSLSICPFAEVAHVGSTGVGGPARTGGSLSFEGGVHVAFGGGRSDEFRVVPLISGGIVRSRTTVPNFPQPETVSTTNGVIEIGLSLIREDSASFGISYAFAFNSSVATSTFIMAVNFAIGHK